MEVPLFVATLFYQTKIRVNLLALATGEAK